MLRHFGANCLPLNVNKKGNTILKTLLMDRHSTRINALLIAEISLIIGPGYLINNNTFLMHCLVNNHIHAALEILPMYDEKDLKLDHENNDKDTAFSIACRKSSLFALKLFEAYP